jgi:hypothetical protein
LQEGFPALFAKNCGVAVTWVELAEGKKIRFGITVNHFIDRIDEKFCVFCCRRWNAPEIVAHAQTRRVEYQHPSGFTLLACCSATVRRVQLCVDLTGKVVACGFVILTPNTILANLNVLMSPTSRLLSIVSSNPTEHSDSLATSDYTCGLVFVAVNVWYIEPVPQTE